MSKTLLCKLRHSMALTSEEEGLAEARHRSVGFVREGTEPLHIGVKLDREACRREMAGRRALMWETKQTAGPRWRNARRLCSQRR